VALATVAFLVLVGTSPAPARAAGPVCPVPHPTAAAGPERPDHQVPARVTPLLASWLDLVLDPIISALTGRQRMIQFGALVMILALAIIWWRK
jgi:hypothetical protein